MNCKLINYVGPIGHTFPFTSPLGVAAHAHLVQSLLDVRGEGGTEGPGVLPRGPASGASSAGSGARAGLTSQPAHLVLRH
ncbi:hypothetical protein EVAR_42077_1 [Eumeta japonica]|uniref:Uncharacterized protein n=1 Tax=Eumeta variegata TaxID=151549 RepID=A0A4C1XUI2_EUMVA|nr:hypothetical protein EVAR_42077_1 [Eumeta japonica]